jgi:hypothetical protein
LPTAKGLLLFVLPLPVFLAIFASLGSGSLSKFLGNALGFALFMLGAVLTRRGFARLRRDAAGQAPGRRPRGGAAPIPYRLAGGATVALATTVTALWGVGQNPFVALAYGASAFIGYALTYGLDPLPRRRPVPRGKGHAAAIQAIDRAAQRIRAIQAAARRLHDRDLVERLERIAVKGDGILATLEESPKDVRRARKFLVVYLEGTERVVEGYAELHGKTSSARLKANFRSLLESIEETFDQQQAKLYEHDLLDLDVQIEVLEKQLKREGVL